MSALVATAMNVKYLLAAVVLSAQLAAVCGFAWILVGASTSVIGLIVDLDDKLEVWVVEVYNEGKHHAHLWCASADDKIGGDDGIWVPPGEKLAWSFRRHRTTQFWCNMDWYGQRVGWDVYVTNWDDAPNPTKWSIRNDGVYDQWKERKWRDLQS